jgi:hypothetical protein
LIPNRRSLTTVRISTVAPASCRGTFFSGALETERNLESKYAAKILGAEGKGHGVFFFLRYLEQRQAKLALRRGLALIPGQKEPVDLFRLAFGLADSGKQARA